MMFFPDIVPPISRHVVPPFVVSCKPLRGPPSLARLLRFAAPAMTVLNVASSESNASAPIERDCNRSVSGTHVGLAAAALVVFQTPPFTAPRYAMFTLPGCGRRRLTAPPTSLLAMPVTPPLRSGPGPCAVQILFVKSAAKPLAPDAPVGTCCFTVKTVPFKNGANATSFVPADTGRSSSLIVSTAVLIVPKRVAAEPPGLLNARFTVFARLVTVLSMIRTPNVSVATPGAKVSVPLVEL